jgi:hypothetical protein
MKDLPYLPNGEPNPDYGMRWGHPNGNHDPYTTWGAPTGPPVRALDVVV